MVPAWLSTFPKDDAQKKAWLLSPANCKFGKAPIENTKPYQALFGEITNFKYYKLIRIAEPILTPAPGEVDKPIEWRKDSDLIGRLSRDITEKLITVEMSDDPWAEESRTWMRRFLFASMRLIMRRHRDNKRNHKFGKNRPYDVWHASQKEKPKVTAYASVLSESEDDTGDDQFKDHVPADQDMRNRDGDSSGLSELESNFSDHPQTCPQEEQDLRQRNSAKLSVSSTRFARTEKRQQEDQSIADGEEAAENQEIEFIKEQISRKRKHMATDCTKQRPTARPASSHRSVCYDREHAIGRHTEEISTPERVSIYETSENDLEVGELTTEPIFHDGLPMIKSEPQAVWNWDDNPSANTASVPPLASPHLAKLIVDSEERSQNLREQELTIEMLKLDRLKLQVIRLVQEEEDSRDLPKTVADIEVLFQEQRVEELKFEIMTIADTRANRELENARMG